MFYSPPLTVSKFWGVLVVWAAHPLVMTGIARVRRARPRTTMLIKATLLSRTTAKRYREGTLFSLKSGTWGGEDVVPRGFRRRLKRESGKDHDKSRKAARLLGL